MLWKTKDCIHLRKKSRPFIDFQSQGVSKTFRVSLAKKVESYLEHTVPIEILTLKQKQDFKAAKVTHICEKSFESVDIKHRDHCHFTGKYSGLAHQSCNVNYKDSHVIPVVFQNSFDYDSHFFIKVLIKSFKGQMELLPFNKEKYISFTKDVQDTRVKLRFID